jgi:hypothetical protein
MLLLKIKFYQKTSSANRKFANRTKSLSLQIAIRTLPHLLKGSANLTNFLNPQIFGFVELIFGPPPFVR